MGDIFEPSKAGKVYIGENTYIKFPTMSETSFEVLRSDVRILDNSTRFAQTEAFGWFFKNYILPKYKSYLRRKRFIFKCKKTIRKFLRVIMFIRDKESDKIERNLSKALDREYKYIVDLGKRF